MANFSDTDKLTSGESRKQVDSPVPKRKSGRLPEREELSESELDKVTGGVMDDPCAGGQYRRR
jgi:bacteriocin-like protein